MLKGAASVAARSMPLFESTLPQIEGISPSPQESLLRFHISRPDLLLKPDNGVNPLASVRTVHAATLFSGGAVIGGVINPQVQDDFARARSQGITSLYVIGMWESTAFSALWMRHWAPEWAGYEKLKPDWIGPSTFSTDSYFPNHLVGSWENLDIVLEAASQESITIVPCFVTNTIGMGGALMRETLRTAPDSIMSRSADAAELNQFREYTQKNTPARSYHQQNQSGPSAGEHTLELFHFQYGHDLYRYRFQGMNGETQDTFLQIKDRQLYRHAWVVDQAKDGADPRIHCIQLGSEDPFGSNSAATVWSDTVHRSVHLTETRRQQILELEPVLSRFPNIRCDMAHLAGVPAWHDYPALARAQGHEIQSMLLETYFDHDQLVRQDPAVSVYANFLFNWLVREDMNIPAVMWHIHEQREPYQQHRLVAYVENHDDKGSTYLPVKGAQALIIAASPVETVLWGQNQRVGDEFRIGAQLHISRDDFNQRQTSLLTGAADYSHLHYLEFFRRVERLSALPVFRSPDSSWDKAVFSAVDSGSTDRVFHIVRELPHTDGTAPDRALVMVDARHQGAGTPLTVDVAASFGLDSHQLSDYLLVNLITGDVQQSCEQLALTPKSGTPSPHSYAYALVPKQRAEAALIH